MLKSLSFFWPGSICFLLVLKPTQILLFLSSGEKFWWLWWFPTVGSICLSNTYVLAAGQIHFLCLLTFPPVAVPRCYFWEHKTPLSFFIHENVGIIQQASYQLLHVTVSAFTAFTILFDFYLWAKVWSFSIWKANLSTLPRGLAFSLFLNIRVLSPLSMFSWDSGHSPFTVSLFLGQSQPVTCGNWSWFLASFLSTVCWSPPPA